MLVSLFLVLAAIWQPADAKICQHGFVKYYNSCYWFSPKAMVATWAEAELYCNTMNSYLVIITSAFEDNFIRGHLRQKAQNFVFWIGANDLQSEGHVQWMSKGSPKDLNYTNWYPGQPDNAGGVEHCIEVRKEFGFRWNDWQCFHHAGFICEQF
ncbi:perlucin-like [Gigantopelta aegis]|uniref:perlucin-like n=1 Tax=Gigantopelta aegis TaxID=1735272 RepID=UPI001B88DDE3|nr:perlucin-like [Gigantopelta aegis]